MEQIEKLIRFAGTAQIVAVMICRVFELHFERFADLEMRVSDEVNFQTHEGTQRTRTNMK